MTFWPLIYYNVRVYWKYCRLLISIAFLFSLKASVWKSYFQLTSCNYVFTWCLRVWSMCWPSPNLLERLFICIVSGAVSVQVTPMGVSLWSHISHPSSNSSSVREKGFVIWLPASLCFLRSEAELWFIVKFPQAGSISRPTELLNGRSCSLGEWPFLERLLLRQVQGLIKVMSFFSAMSSIDWLFRVQRIFCGVSVHGCGMITWSRWLGKYMDGWQTKPDPFSSTVKGSSGPVVMWMGFLSSSLCFQ